MRELELGSEKGYRFKAFREFSVLFLHMVYQLYTHVKDGRGGGGGR